jgi:hypothetical protein
LHQRENPVETILDFSSRYQKYELLSWCCPEVAQETKDTIVEMSLYQQNRPNRIICGGLI